MSEPINTSATEVTEPLKVQSNTAETPADQAFVIDEAMINKLKDELSLDGNTLLMSDEPVTPERLAAFTGVNTDQLSSIMTSLGFPADFQRALGIVVDEDTTQEVPPPRRVRRFLRKTAGQTGRAAKTTVLVPWNITKTGAGIMVDGLQKAGHKVKISSHELAVRFNAWLNRHPWAAAFLGLVLTGLGLGITIAVMYIVVIIVLIAFISIIGAFA